MRAVYIVTCGLCGHSWQRRAASDDEVAECIFCGSTGRLRVGLMPSDVKGTEHVEVRLECPGTAL